MLTIENMHGGRHGRRSSILIIIVLLLLTISAVPADASPVTWDLTLTFTDAATADGTFVYDASTNTYSAIDITTTAGTIPGYHYTQSPIVGNSFFALLNEFDPGTFANHILFFSIDSGSSGADLSVLAPHPLTNAFEEQDKGGDNKLIRGLSEGVVVPAGTTVPEPPTLLQLGLGLAVLCAWGRKKFKCI